jgi:hypothetical protein
MIAGEFIEPEDESKVICFTGGSLPGSIEELPIDLSDRGFF